MQVTKRKIQATIALLAILTMIALVANFSAGAPNPDQDTFEEANALFAEFTANNPDVPAAERELLFDQTYCCMSCTNLNYGRISNYESRCGTRCGTACTTHGSCTSKAACINGGGIWAPTVAGFMCIGGECV